MKSLLTVLLRCVALCFGFLALTTQAGELRELIDGRTKTLLTTIRSELADFEKHPSKLHALVDKEIGDLFHFEYMGRFAVGKHWKKLDKQQQTLFLKEFRTLLIATYATTLLRFQYEDITVKDEEPDRKPKRYTVTMLATQNGTTYEVNYKIAETSAGPKVIDVLVEGLSLLVNYRTSFSDFFSTKGAEETLIFLQNKNRENAQSN